MFSPGTVSDITLNIFLILVEKEKTLQSIQQQPVPDIRRQNSLLKKSSVKFQQKISELLPG